MGKLYGLWVVFYIAVVLKTWTLVEGELVLLVSLTRHGSRAPNTVIDELCPANEANRRSYNVPPGQLTEKGMQQALKLGEFVRKTYVESMEFMPPTLGSGGSNGTYSARFMSDNADRCLQTAQVMAMGLFPNGTGPPGFPNQPVAVQTEQKQFANVLAAAHGACLGQQKADNNVYDQTRGKDLIDDAKNITQTVAKACGTRVQDYKNADGGKEGLVLGVKDVADMLDFDQQQGLPRLASVSKHTHEKMTALAFTLLQERYYSSRQQMTYWAGDLPTQLLEDFQSASERHANGDKPKRLYIGYHGHRELLYGLAHLIGWSFDVAGMPKALGTSSIPPTTTMFFELHYRAGQEETNQADGSDGGDATGDDDGAQSSMHVEEKGGGEGGGREGGGAAGGEGGGGGAGGGNSSVESGGEEGYYYVRTYTWTPDLGQQEVVLDFCSDIAAGNGCPLSALKDSVLDSIVDVGSWQDICHHVPFTQAEQLAQSAVYNQGGDAEGDTDSATDSATDSTTDHNADGKPDGNSADQYAGKTQGDTESSTDDNADVGSDSDSVESVDQRVSLTTKICAVAAIVAAAIVVWVGTLAVRATWMDSEGLRGESYQIVP